MLGRRATSLQFILQLRADSGLVAGKKRVNSCVLDLTLARCKVAVYFPLKLGNWAFEAFSGCNVVLKGEGLLREVVMQVRGEEGWDKGFLFTLARCGPGLGFGPCCI